MPRICSDHSPLLGFDFDSPRPKRAPFRIQKMWFSHPSFLDFVKDNWSVRLDGAPPFVFTSKLKRLKDALKIWNRMVADARKAVDDVRSELATMLKHKSRTNWLEDGDQNTRFFHNSIRMRRSQNTISELKVSTNSTLFLQDEIKDYIVDHYRAKFNGGAVNIDPSLFDYEHESISAVESVFMDAIPSLEEVKEAVFDLGADSAPGPDGFTCSFFRICWNIISIDLFNAIANCWAMKKIPNGINSSFIVLIPKNNKSDAIKDYRPIGLSNFFFKIITKIMATRLGTVLNKLISEEQVAFMKGRNIHENIALASELINEISVERKHDVLSRNLSKLFAARSMHHMVSKKGVAPTHLLFADDILIFCKGNLHSLQNLKEMLGMYQRASGQYVSYAKSKFYFGGDRHSRAVAIANFMGMESALFPDKLVLIKSVISSYLLHSMAVYKWPCTAIKTVERAIRNFLWSGDAEKRKYYTVLYEDLCRSRRKGGLGLKKLNDVNRAMLMKLWVSIRDSNKTWARFLKAKYFKSAKAAIRGPVEVSPAAALFSRSVVHPTLSVQEDCEDVSYITWHCKLAKRIWNWAAAIFKLQPNEDLVASYKVAKGRSRMIKDLWLVANLAIVTELWKLRNKAYFENMRVRWLEFKGRVHQHRSCDHSDPIEVTWSPPNPGELMICCDGASLDNPGQAGSGVVFRDSNSAVLGVLCVGLGWQTNFYAELESGPHSSNALCYHPFRPVDAY
ncbi:uncharacterized protein LOC113344808 [Papaver somniferum]|uniref:uncharacterized protein LOC113344808 n=1 Tax=Papaver somniferum TaxID=3469 RepID=UPI000E6FE055|nr:uncharacterized protein LOC113344808 [Papaver somniferum]